MSGFVKRMDKKSPMECPISPQLLTEIDTFFKLALYLINKKMEENGGTLIKPAPNAEQVSETIANTNQAVMGTLEGVVTSQAPATVSDTAVVS